MQLGRCRWMEYPSNAAMLAGHIDAIYPVARGVVASQTAGQNLDAGHRLSQHQRGQLLQADRHEHDWTLTQLPALLCTLFWNDKV